MLDVVLLGMLIIGFFIGLKRGFILQLIHMVGAIIALIVAYVYYEDLAGKLTLWIPYPSIEPGSTLNMVLDGVGFEDAFYNVIAFAIIFFAVKIVLGIIGSMLDFVAGLPVIRTLNVWAGGILGFIEMYVLIFILLYIAVLLPIESIQQWLDGSFIGKAIIEHTPFLSGEFKKWWIDYMNS